MRSRTVSRPHTADIERALAGEMDKLARLFLKGPATLQRCAASPGTLSIRRRRHRAVNVSETFHAFAHFLNATLYHRHNFGNDIARLLKNNRIANSNIFFLYKILIVKRRARNG